MNPIGGCGDSRVDFLNLLWISGNSLEICVVFRILLRYDRDIQNKGHGWSQYLPGKLSNLDYSPIRDD